MAWLATLALAEGRRAGLLATLGVALGLAGNALLASLGVAALIGAEPALARLLHWAGALFMGWLAWRGWLAADTPLGGGQRGRRHLAAGLLLNLANPKALVFFAVVVPPFLGGRAATLAEALALAGVSVGIATAVHLAIVLGAGRAHGWLAQGRAVARVRRVLALVMAGVALWLALAAPA
ncbi:MAG: LysE family transporter [Proteobacteria bacterium]|nr:LysE family transporter [Pseudomonadota bacterium]